MLETILNAVDHDEEILNLRKTKLTVEEAKNVAKHIGKIAPAISVVLLPTQRNSA